jgi:hypothetical protein
MMSMREPIPVINAGCSGIEFPAFDCGQVQ